jgi:hypothetical protein
MPSAPLDSFGAARCIGGWLELCGCSYVRGCRSLRMLESCGEGISACMHMRKDNTCYLTTMCRRDVGEAQLSYECLR